MRIPERKGDQLIVGVAIEMPDPYGPRLQRARRDLEDPLADAIPPHVTLVPPVAVDPAAMPHIQAHLTDCAATSAPFRMCLRGTGTFRPVSDVVFIQVAAGIAECERLEIAVRSGPLNFPTRFTFHPHVTVAHDLTDEQLDRAFAEMAGFYADFEVKSFSLFQYGPDDEQFRSVGSFTLSGLPHSSAILA